MEIVAGLSGDDVDPRLIIAGGRGARRGRGGPPPQLKFAAPKKKGADSDSDDL